MMEILNSAAGQLFVGAAISVGLVILLLKAIKGFYGNGKLSLLQTSLDRVNVQLVEIEHRLDSIERNMAYRDGEQAGMSGRYDAQT